MSLFIKVGASIKDRLDHKRLAIFNVYNSDFPKRVLISYLTTPFSGPPKYGHSNFAEALKIGEVFHQLDFQVDVIRYDGLFKQINFQNRKYDIVFGLEPNFLAAVKKFNPKHKIYYATGSYWYFQNLAEQARIEAIFARRHAKLTARRLASKHQSSELADGVVLIGNDQTKSTYQNHAKQIEKVRVSAFSFFSFDQISKNKNWERASKNFLWFGGFGATHKGLDLLLEIFAKHPDIHLYVCGEVTNERDFVKAYKNELFSTSNIHYVGWVSPESEKFAQLMKICAFTILPSCSEGMCSSVPTNMHSGLIPLVSRETGLDVASVGTIFTDNKLKTIEQVILSASKIDTEKIKTMAKKSSEFAKNNYNLDIFAQDFTNAIKKIIDR